ncbi:MAG: hypothetical protein LBK60_10255 [Verrucomicrobiales bacterium]|jgi:hypothetical protein|nr:hypothetical protein [Verrucomicrobiales bacterium]
MAIRKTTKQRIKHPDPAWWHGLPAPKKIEMGTRVYDTLYSVRTKYGVPETLFNRLREVNTAIATLFNCREAVKQLAKYYTELQDLLLNVGSNEIVTFERIKDKIFPDAAAKINGGLLGVLMDIEAALNQNAEYLKDQSIGIFLGYILPAKNNPDLLKLTAAAIAKFTGGDVILNGKMPWPAKYWYILVDRNDGHGQTFAEKIAGAKFIDRHELPKHPVTWTYTVELQDKNGIAIGKVCVTSVTVWKGRDDQGPEAGGN